MNQKEIKDLINLMNDHDLVELEVEREGNKIKLKKANGDVTDYVQRAPLEYKLEPAAAPKPSEDAPRATGNRLEIESPMVGTFYRSPSPEAPPFVEIGQNVEVGQVVCIVEAMKLMNEIKSEVRGKVAEILVDNAQPVEFGQALFVLEPQ